MYLSSISTRLLLYDINSWDLKKSHGSYDSIIRDISWSDDGKYLLQVNPKGFVEILSTTDQEVKSLQHVPFRDTWSAVFHRDGHRHIAIGTKNGNVVIWDTKNKSITKSFPTQPQQSCVNFISYNLKNTSLAATMQNGETIIYGLSSNIPVLTVKLAFSRSISAMKFHPESRSLLGLATDEGHIALRDVSTNRDKVLFDNVHASPVSDFTFSQINKDVMLSSGYDKIMHVYDIRLQNVVSTIRTNYTLTSIATNPENQVALGTKNGIILLYDLRDMGAPLRVLKGHNDEVRRLNFQPFRKKGAAVELSLKEDVDVQIPLQKSPVRSSRFSDIFTVNDSPPKSSPEQATHDSRMDSFLVMMGLDKTGEVDDEPDKSESERKFDNNGFTLDLDKNLTKISTPLNNKCIEQFGISSPNITPGEGPAETIEIQKTAGDCKTEMDTKSMEDLKDFIKLSLSEMADDNRTYFLKTMMSLTKQKLFLEKQLLGMSEQMQSLVQNQNALVETNRKLALEIDKLKMAQQYPL